jgi:hypothetical protein
MQVVAVVLVSRFYHLLPVLGAMVAVAQVLPRVLQIEAVVAVILRQVDQVLSSFRTLAHNEHQAAR